MILKKKWTKPAIELMLALYEDHTYVQIAEKLEKRFKVKYTANAVRKAHERYAIPIVEKAKKRQDHMPKILIYDIETCPIEAYVWRLWDNNVGLNMIKEDWAVISWAAKWMGDDKTVMYEDTRDKKDFRDDKKILEKLWKLLDEADIVLTQNGVKFDNRKVNARFIMHGMEPPSSYRNIDTLRMAKKHFGFTSNKLEYMTDKLCTKYKKSGHAKFSGFALWKGCMEGNVEAWDEMKDYNVLDVLSLEELAEKLLPWDTTINFSVYTEENVCSCGSTELKKNGFYYTNASKFQKYRCKQCGAESRDKTNLLSKELRKSLKPGTSRKR
jgi:hypothetical protein